MDPAPVMDYLVQSKWSDWAASVVRFLNTRKSCTQTHIPIVAHYVAAQGHAASMRRMSLQQGSAASSSRRTNQHLPHSTSAGNLQMYAQQLARSPSSSSSSSSTNGPTTSSGSGDAYPVNGPVLFDKARRLSPGVNNLFSSSYNNVYAQIWKTMLTLASDSLPAVKRLAQQLVNQINLKATVMAKPQHVLQENRRTPSSAPNSPSTRNHSASPQNLSDSPPPAVLNIPIEIVKPVPIRAGEQPPPARPQNPAPIGSQFPHSQQFTRVRKLFDKGPSITYEDMESVNISTKDLNLSTNFSNWCCKYFAQSVMRAPEEMDPYSSLHQEREWRFLRNAVARKEAREQQQRAVMSRLDDQIFINRNQGIPVALRFQHFSPHVIVADKEGVCVWNWENGEKLNYFSHLNHKDTKITSMDIMNAHDISLLMTGCDDGAVQIWRNYLPDSSGPVELVSSWHALSDMLPSIKGAGLVLDWEQESGMLLASGDVRTIRVWDTQRELKLQDIPTGADSCVTSLACDSVGRSLLIAGCGDGSVRLYDRRLAPTESRVMTLREHNSWVVNVHLQKGAGDGKIISASVNGDVRFWDPRFTESVKLIQTNFSLLTTMAVHQQANIFACGSANQLISVFNMSGDTLSNIKYYEGFIGQRIGPVSCLAFHPLKVYLASGSRDSFLSIYSTEKKAR